MEFSKTFDEVYVQLPGNGWLTEDEARLLWLCCEKTDGPILEVGCFEGRSTCLLASFGREVHSVDPFKGFSTEDPDGSKAHRAFVDNVLGRNLHNVTLHKMRVEDWEPDHDLEQIGLAYLDGDHTYDGTVEQIKKALTLKPAVIAIHDVNDSGGGAEIKRAALSMLGPWDLRAGRLAAWGHCLTNLPNGLKFLNGSIKRSEACKSNTKKGG